MNNQIQLVLKSSTDEISLNDHELGIYLTPDLDGLVGLPEIRTTSGVNAGYDGGWTSAQNYDARSITIKGVIANTDVATVESLRKKLVSLAGQGKSEELTLDLVTEAGNAYTLQVRTIALDMAMQSVLNKQEFMLQLRADDPLIYDASETTHEALIQVAKATGGFQINFELPLAITGSSEETVVENNGLERVPTITRLYGALHNPKIINHTTNQFMQLETDLGFSEGQWVTPSDTLQGKIIEIENAPAEAPLASFQLDGETSQNGTPTPSAPVAVRTVTGENTVQICGKNLFDKDNANILSAYIDSGQQTITSNNNNRIIWIKCEPSTTYTISKTPANYQRGVAYTKELPSSGVQTYGYSSGQNNWGNLSFTTGADAEYLVIRIWVVGQDAVSLDDMLASVQIEKGSMATTYEPYQGQSYEINLGKNLLDPTSASWVQGYWTYGGGALLANNYRVCQTNKTLVVEETTFTFTTDPNIAFRVDFWNADGTASGQSVAWYDPTSTAYTKSFTVPAGKRYTITLGYKNNAHLLSPADVALYNLMLEKGSQATSYAAYFEPIELCKIGTYQDYIYKSDGKWYVRKEVGKGIYDGSEDENWTWSSGSRIDIAISDALLGSASNNPVLSNRYKATWAVSNGNIFLSGIWHGAGIIDTTNAPDLSSWKTYIASNNVIIYYALATPTDTEITNEALIAQLETLLNTARTYAGINNIFTITQNEQGTMEIRYYTEKTQDYRDVIEIDSRLRTITLNGLDIYHLQTDGSDFLILAPGENRLSLQSDITGDNGYAEVSYKQGYLSI